MYFQWGSVGRHRSPRCTRPQIAPKKTIAELARPTEMNHQMISHSENNYYVTKVKAFKVFEVLNTLRDGTLFLKKN